MRWVLHPTRLVLILAVVVTAVVPALRREFVWNARALAQAIPHWPKSSYTESLAGGAPATRSGGATLLKAYPRDVTLRIGIARRADPLSAPTATERRALAEALRLAPRDPVVLSLAALRAIGSLTLSHDREEEFGLRRAERRKRIKENKPGWKPLVLSEAKLTPALDRLDAWAAADPENAAPDALAADLLFGARKDSEALARAEAAARKRFFTLYNLDMTRALMHRYRLCGMPAGNAAFDASVGSLEETRPLRDLAHVMQGIGWDRFDDGDKTTAFRYWLTAAGIGRLMDSHQRETMIEQLVGVSVECIGYAPIYHFVRAPQAKARFDGGDYLPGDAYASFVAIRGKPAADRIYQRLAALTAWRDNAGKATGGDEAQALSPTDLALIPYGWCLAGRNVSMYAFPAALVAALLSLLALIVGRRSQRTLSPLWSAILIAIAICAPIAIGASGTIRFAVTLWLRGLDRANMPWSAIAQWLRSVVAVGLPLLLAAVLALAAWWVARKRRVRYRSALAGALRQVLPSALAVLALVWVIAAAVAVREGGLYARYQMRMYQVGELTMLQELGRGK
jgi:hypothetical protein